MKKLTLLLLTLMFLPLSAEATIKRYARGYSEFWCKDLEGANPNDPNALKGYCYGKAVTPSSVHPVMTGMKTRSAASMRGPTGIESHKESGLVTGGSSASVQVPYYKWAGDFTLWVQVGEVYCPAGTMTKASLFYSHKKKLGISTICVVLDSPGWKTSCKPITTIVGVQLGWTCGYVPIDDCWAKCVVSHYTIYVAGASTVPAYEGSVHKGWELDPETGVVTCTGFLVSFIPYIPGILPCANCKDEILWDN